MTEKIEIDYELLNKLRAVSDVIGYGGDRKVVCQMATTNGFVRMTKWDQDVVMGRLPDATVKPPLLEWIHNNETYYDKSTGEYKFGNARIKVDIDSPTGNVFIGALESFVLTVERSLAGRFTRRETNPMLALLGRYYRNIDTGSGARLQCVIDYPEVRDIINKELATIVVSPFAAPSEYFDQINAQMKNSVEALRNVVTKKVLALVDDEIDIVAGTAEASVADNKLTDQELTDMETTLAEHRMERVSRPLLDAVSKTWVTTVPLQYRSVGAKFLPALAKAKKEHPNINGILLAGTGVHNQFGPIIQKFYPGIPIVACDVNPIAREAAERYGFEFHQLDVASMLELPKYFSYAVISDAVLPRETKVNRKRATHAYLADNMHQLDVLTSLVVGRPFVIAKIFAPFGVVEFDGQQLSVREELDKCRPFATFPSIARHQTEMVVYKDVNVTWRDDFMGRIVRNSVKYEAARHVAFQCGFYPTEDFFSGVALRYSQLPYAGYYDACTAGIKGMQMKKITCGDVPVKSSTDTGFKSRYARSTAKAFTEQSSTIISPGMTVNKEKRQASPPRQEYVPKFKQDAAKEKQTYQQQQQQQPPVAPVRKVDATGKNILDRPAIATIPTSGGGGRTMPKTPDNAILDMLKRKGYDEAACFSRLKEYKANSREIAKELRLHLFRHYSLTVDELIEFCKARFAMDEIEACYHVFHMRSMAVGSRVMKLRDDQVQQTRMSLDEDDPIASDRDKFKALAEIHKN